MNNTTMFHTPDTDWRFRIVHDIKSPINIILSSASMLRMKASTLSSEPDTFQQYIHYIEQNCHRLLRMTSNLLEPSPSCHPKLLTSHCDIVAFLTCTLRDLSLFAEQRNIELSFDNRIPDPCFLNFDRDQLERLLWNLLINALKHSPRGGNITVDLHSDNDYIYIGIRDNGDGITAAFLSAIFDPHVTDGRAEGEGITSSGLGLPIVRELTELHRGTIFVSSTAGGGSCFTFSISRHLPLTMGNASISPV
ncbi:MAG: HAMP domain-containing histidine kinase [Firmicutes bacterium]|nr:HAMP domain-containing histidine kinase [Bacillota bacterium]